jgi:uncharacterized 2Fe-2S/4Fe-4S cluster protein (DUF4445 family)
VKTNNHKIQLLTEDRQISAEHGQKLLEALIAAGIFLRADCGGKRRCGKCMLKIPETFSTYISAPDESETKYLGEKELAAGSRLACCTEVLGEISIEIPETSRLSPEVAQKGPTMLFDKPFDRLTVLSKVEGLSALKPASAADTEGYGLAVDLGTTTIAVYLCNLSSAEVTASISVRNPQVLFGDDVMSRIGAVGQNEDLLSRLQKMVVKAIEWGTNSLCRSTRIDPKKIKAMVVVGNTTMIHLFVGVDPTSIGMFPYNPQFVEEQIFSAYKVGFGFNPDAEIRTLPLITGFIGADIVSATLAAELSHTTPGTMLVDVGTNGEIMFLGKEGLVATSCATGPAFEGAAIRHGMHAVSGAIDAVKINGTATVTCSVIQKDPGKPKKIAGLCGTGVVSAVAELLRTKLILPDGAFNRKSDSPHLRLDENDAPECVLAEPGEAEGGRAITFTQKDVRAIQLAKGALRTGIDLLCLEAGIKRPQKILLAGAFGSYIRKKDAMTIGMFPEINEADIEIVGNAAGAGAILTLFDKNFSNKAGELTQSTRVLDLASHPNFQEIFIGSLEFPKTSLNLVDSV